MSIDKANIYNNVENVSYSMSIGKYRNYYDWFCGRGAPSIFLLFFFIFYYLTII